VERFCGPIAEGRKPAGKWLATLLTAVIRPRLPGRARNAPAKGQAGAAGFDAGQIRQEGKGGTVLGLIPSSINQLEGFDERDGQLR
jgi:hypothetical protein